MNERVWRVVRAEDGKVLRRYLTERGAEAFRARLWMPSSYRVEKSDPIVWQATR